MSNGRYELIVAPSARRQLSEELPEAVAFAAFEFIVGPLLDNPNRVGKRLRPPLTIVTALAEERTGSSIESTRNVNASPLSESSRGPTRIEHADAPNIHLRLPLELGFFGR